ncbi:MAG: hypothetical protein BGO39_15940 [Chloroflexi bacterium 54-19]|nr:MAG: hypothetical protein BGO39_15940 [Chloroflexi bacterium 54-19]
MPIFLCFFKFILILAHLLTGLLLFYLICSERFRYIENLYYYISSRNQGITILIAFWKNVSENFRTINNFRATRIVRSEALSLEFIAK